MVCIKVSIKMFSISSSKVLCKMQTDQELVYNIVMTMDGKLAVIKYISIIICIFFITNSISSGETLPGDNCLGKKIIKSVEKITIIGTRYKKEVKARIDTGATHSSIDENLAKAIGFNEIAGATIIRNAQGEISRYVVKFSFILKNTKIKTSFSLANRQKLNYLVLIGREDLKGFLIDPEEK